MKYLSLITLVVLLYSITLVSAEINMWSNVIIDTNKSTVTHWTDYRIYDTSPSGIGKHKIVPVILQWQHPDLPYDIGAVYAQYAPATIDWCNFTILHYKNTYNEKGEVTGTTIVETNNYFQSVSAANGFEQIDLVDLDTLSSYMTCHYTNPNTLYIDGVLFGLTTTYMPAFQCKGCEDHSFEELTKENEKVQEAIDSELSIYNNLYKLIRLNYKVWLYIKWIMMILLLVFGVTLATAGLYFIYSYFKKLEKVSR